MDASIYSGQRYRALAPDTLDLAEHARLAINGLAGIIDPEHRYTVYFLVYYTPALPHMVHSGVDTTLDPKCAESFPLMRLMSGSRDHLGIEAAQRRELLSRISPEDGLYWNPADPDRPWFNSYKPRFDGDRQLQDLANVLANGRMLRTLMAWLELNGDDRLNENARGLALGLRRIAIHRDDYSYYPDGGFGEPFNYPRSGWLRTDEPQSETEGGEGSVVLYQGNQIYALARWSAVSGDKDALDMAARFTRFCMLPRFWGGFADPRGAAEDTIGHVARKLPDHPCIPGAEQGHWHSHFHARAVALRGMLEYARVAGDDRVFEFIRRAYEYTWTLSVPRVGWINCAPVTLNLCEGCALGDMVALAIRLTDAGLGDYWDDVDAVVRNHLVEQQVTHAGLLERIAQASRVRGPEEYSPYPGHETRENVIARTLGTYFGLSLPASVPNPWVTQCCTGNATQGLYYAWEGIVREEGDTAQVNLLLNRAAKLLDVDSHLPYQGKVVLHNKGARRVSVRIPSWAPRREIRADVSGAPRPLSWVGNYLVFDDLKPGDKIAIQFPVRETTARYTIASGTRNEQAYTCTFRGSTLVDISPRDASPTSYPLYLRDHMRKDEAPVKEVERFVADRKILNW